MKLADLVVAQPVYALRLRAYGLGCAVGFAPTITARSFPACDHGQSRVHAGIGMRGHRRAHADLQRGVRAGTMALGPVPVSDCVLSNSPSRSDLTCRS